MPHPKETEIIGEMYIVELEKEREMATQRYNETNNRYDAGAAKGLEWAEKWFKERFSHLLKED